ncbi:MULTISPECIES: hypothetical protein [unclassified Nonomuraea]|uniref:hypothetical protein n=1 Tax=unclassified Nonomuraea TaxID=2593643 RepID=UPI00340BEF88
MTYGPPEPPRATSSPPIILLVSGLAAVVAFILGVFVGYGAEGSSASPAPRVTVTVEGTGPPSASGPATPPAPTDAPTDAPQTDPLQTGPAQTGPARTGSATPPTTGPAQTGPTQTGPTQTGPTQTGPTQTGPTQTGPTQTGPTQTGPTQTGPTQPGPAQTGPTAGMRTFVVGVDIQPGMYRTTGPVAGSTNCFWARLNSTSPDLGSVINAGAPTGPASVTIEPGDKAFQTAGCAQWTKA